MLLRSFFFGGGGVIWQKRMWEEENEWAYVQNCPFCVMFMLMTCKLISAEEENIFMSDTGIHRHLNALLQSHSSSISLKFTLGFGHNIAQYKKLHSLSQNSYVATLLEELVQDRRVQSQTIFKNPSPPDWVVGAPRCSRPRPGGWCWRRPRSPPPGHRCWPAALACALYRHRGHTAQSGDDGGGGGGGVF